LKAEQHHDARRGGILLQPALDVTEQRQQLVTDNLGDLLSRGQALENGLIHRPVADTVDECLDDLEIDIGLEQREADFAQRGLDVLFRQSHFSAK
jgi:hypothetical protein